MELASSCLGGAMPGGEQSITLSATGLTGQVDVAGHSASGTFSTATGLASARQVMPQARQVPVSVRPTPIQV